MIHLWRIPLFILMTYVIIIFLTHSTYAASPDIRILDVEGNVITVFTPYSIASARIGSVFATDLGHDGISEILVGGGEDNDPSVSVFRKDGSLIGSFLAYDSAYRGGVNITACDLDNDGATEIITGAAWNGGPHVRIFDAMGNVKYPGFFAYDKSFTGGVNVACGDVTGDGINNIVVGAGLSGGPHVKIFDAFGNLLLEKFVDDASKNLGVAIAVDDFDHDGVNEIFTSTMGYASPTIVVWKFDSLSSSLIAVHSELSEENVFELISPVGILNDTMLVATQGYTEPIVKNTDNTIQFAPFSQDATHAISASILLEQGKAVGIVVANISPKMNDDISEKSILIDKTHQRLTAYEYGVPMHTFLVSTAKSGYVTPIGKTVVRDKLLYHDYVWVFGVGDPRNYNVPNVKWNLRIYDHIYIHWAYWHNNFGHPMSHGCINANAENSEWIYSWSDVGTTVNIIE